MSTTLTFTVSAGEHKSRLDKTLAAHSSELSRSRLKTLIEAGDVMVDDVVVTDPAYALQEGEDITLSYRLEAPTLEPVALPLDIVFEDEHVIVINKPAGLVVHPGDGGERDTLVQRLLAHCGKLSDVGMEGLRPGIVHRLDRETSGLLVAAKTNEAHYGLLPQFQDHSIERMYAAIVWGVPFPRQQTIAAPIGRHPRQRQKMAVVARGRDAVTHFEVEEIYEDIACCLHVTLETGRTHQIRVHMSHIGFPLVGDPVYGRSQRTKREKALKSAGYDPHIINEILAFPHQALHAMVLGFRHPVSDQPLRFSSPLPEALKTLRCNFSRNLTE